jgi:Holliday junction resolvase RusA-like endonuclease
MELTFDVLGRPAPQGSKKSIGNNRFIESSKFLPAWRNTVREAAEQAVTVSGWVRVSGPVELEVMFYLDRPATVKRPYPTVPPDLDKLLRAVGDSCSGVVYDDDSQVIRTLAWKVYADAREPGAFIRVNELSQFDNEAFQSFDFLDLPE